MDSVAVLLQNSHAEAVESTDIAGIVVAGEPADAPLHLLGGFIGKCDTEDIGRHNANLIDQIGKPVRQRAGLA